MTEPSNAVVVAPLEGAKAALQARIVRDSSDKEVLTEFRDMDTHSALASGLRDYFARISILQNEREVKFRVVRTEWSESEDEAAYPAGAVLGLNPGTYDRDRSPPKLTGVGNSEQNRYLREASELTLDLAFLIEATDKFERMALATAIEDAMSPFDWMAGVRLALPYYFGAFASYLLRTVDYEDTAESSQQRRRRVILGVRGNLVQYVPVGFVPRMRVLTHLEVSSTSGPAT